MNIVDKLPQSLGVPQSAP